MNYRPTPQSPLTGWSGFSHLTTKGAHMPNPYRNEDGEPLMTYSQAMTEYYIDEQDRFDDYDCRECGPEDED